MNGKKYETSFSHQFQRAPMKLTPPSLISTLCKMVEITKKRTELIQTEMKTISLYSSLGRDAPHKSTRFLQ